MIVKAAPLNGHPVVTRAEWIEARRQHLAREKALTRKLDELYAERRALPWVKVEQEYLFEGPAGTETLGELFGRNSQLVVYHFMYGPEWKEGCPGCSFVCDHIDGANLHLAHHDVSLIAVSRAPFVEFQAFKKRMGWKFKWVSSHGSDFNFDYHVSFTKESLAKGGVLYNFAPKSTDTEGETHGVSVFYKDEAGDIYHTYSTYARGCDILLGAHHYLDMTPLGRNETSTMSWMRHHDKYENAAPEHSCCGGGNGQ